MIGREIYNSPYMLAEVDQQIYGEKKAVISREQVINSMVDYVNVYVNEIPEHGKNRAWHVLRHVLGLCNGLAGARQFRRHLSECAGKEGANGDVLLEAFANVKKLNEIIQ
jgi:tRNA-dihydrouridine synthase A